jgi:hypothetical protein
VGYNPAEDRTVPGVFISYRRKDSSGYSGRLFDVLSAQFGKENIYMDLDTIEGGDDFTAVIKEKVNLADVLVAVIGNQWLTITEDDGERRLDSAADFVHIEIAMALERGIRVIPVLVGGAIMPRADELPVKLRTLCQRQAVEIRDPHFHSDAQLLIDVLRRELHDIGTGPRQPNLKRLVPRLVGVGVIVIPAGFWLLHLTKPPSTLGTSNPAPQKQSAPANSPPAPGTDVQQGETSTPTKPRANVAGKWTAVVKYDWGETYETVFDFEVDGSTVTGMAGYGADREGDGRTILEGKIEGDRISFTTKSLVTRRSNEPDGEESHRYKGTVEAESIRFTMVTDSVYYPRYHPVVFTAHRIKAGPVR